MLKFFVVAILSLSLSQIKACKEKLEKNEIECIKHPVKEDCICTMEYNPVCGCDLITYSNACQAECSGIKDYIKGECEKIEKL